MASNPGTVFFLLCLVLPYVASLPAKTEKLISDNGLYYSHGHIECVLCPPGSYVEKHCTSDKTKGQCEICPEGRYIEFSSGLTECLSCSRCRDDEVEESSCSPNKNTVCNCKTGQFCSPGQPCEICILCKTSCPEGQIVKTDCSSTSDLVCTSPDSPKEDTPGSSTNTIIYIVVPLVVVTIMSLIFIVFCVLCSNRESTQIRNKLSDSVRFCKENEGSGLRSKLIQTKVYLQFPEEENKEDIITKTYPIIGDLVPVKHFENLMLSLELSQNEIDIAKEDNPKNTRSLHSAMLHTWHMQHGFDINELLQGLQKRKLPKVAQKIAERLIEEGLYIEQTQQPT